MLLSRYFCLDCYVVVSDVGVRDCVTAVDVYVVAVYDDAISVFDCWLLCRCCCFRECCYCVAVVYVCVAVARYYAECSHIVVVVVSALSRFVVRYLVVLCAVVVIIVFWLRVL